jgi:hypothetical protein
MLMFSSMIQRSTKNETTSQSPTLISCASISLTLLISVQVNFFTTRGYDPATGQLTSVSVMNCTSQPMALAVPTHWKNEAGSASQL